MRANYRFHDVIYEAADVPLVEQVAKSARRTFLSRWRPGGPEIDDLYRQNVNQHRAILDALVAGSSDGARALAHEHVLHSCRLLEVILEHRGLQAAAPRQRAREVRESRSRTRADPDGPPSGRIHPRPIERTQWATGCSQ